MNKKETNNILDYVVVLGSGKSINDLSQEELELINASKVKIAINKFGAFYESSKINPTHIFFYDDYEKSAILFLKYILSKFRKQKIYFLTIIVSKNYKGFLVTSQFLYYLKKGFKKIIFYIKKSLLKLGRVFVKPLSVLAFNKFKKIIGREIEKKDLIRFTLIPRKSQINFVEVQDWNKNNNYWAKSLNEKLYHYRGSLTSVLNYVSILYPNQNILLAGVDFNTYGYFFSEKKLSKLPFKTSDWTTNISKENKKHFSIIDYKGTKMDDEFPFVINELKKTGNTMYSLSKTSYLVEKGFVSYYKENN